MTTQNGQFDYLSDGDWNAQCALCGRKGKASEMKQLEPGVPGGGLYVHSWHEYKRNPQDFARGIPDQMTPPWTQPQTDVFIFPTYNIDEDTASYTLATSSTYTSILTIFEDITVTTLTLSGTGALVVNNWGIVSALVNPGPATITLRNYGVWPV
jgi:hypothetical protein